MLTRRDALKAAAAAGLSPFAPAFAQGKRPLKVNLLGFALGIHVPTTAALLDIMPGMGYEPATQRLDQIRTLTQTLIAGAAELGETDSITVMSAVEQGADLKIVGLWYMHTSLVFLANADKVREFKDLEKPDNIVAINGKGDITHVMLLGPLIKRGVDVKKLNLVEIGGSGARMQALQSGRVPGGARAFRPGRGDGEERQLQDPARAVEGIWRLDQRDLGVQRRLAQEEGERARGHRPAEGADDGVPQGQRRPQLVHRRLPQARHAQGRQDRHAGEREAGMGRADARDQGVSAT